MNMQKKFLIIGVGALTSVSCAIAPMTPPQPSSVPVERQEKVTRFDELQIPAPAESFPVKPQPPVALPSPIAEPSPMVAKIDKRQFTPIPPPVAWLPTSLLSLRNISAVPGGIAWITLSSQSDTLPKIMYQKHRAVVLRHGDGWVAIVGVPLDAKLGQHSVIDQETGERYSFRVKHKKYKTQRLRIKNKRKVNPNRRDLQRIEREYLEIKAALATPWKTTSTSPLPLILPVQGRFSSPFGLRRYFNGQRRNPHKGLDIAARQGTPIIAAAAGKVINTGHYFFTGKTVFIDHGQGVVTLYGHMNKILVSPGEFVEKRQIIGRVGKTGRATGPHLHWGVSLNNTMVDPILMKQ